MLERCRQLRHQSYSYISAQCQIFKIRLEIGEYVYPPSYSASC